MTNRFEKNLKDNLREFFDESGLTRVELAEIADTTDASLRRWIKDSEGSKTADNVPSIKKVDLFAKHFGVHTNFFFIERAKDETPTELARELYALVQSLIDTTNAKVFIKTFRNMIAHGQAEAPIDLIKVQGEVPESVHRLMGKVRDWENFEKGLELLIMPLDKKRG